MNMDGEDAVKKPDISRKPFRIPTRRCIYIIVAVTVLCIISSIALGVLLRARPTEDECPKGIHCNWHSVPHSVFLKDDRCDFWCTTQPCMRSAEYALSRIDSNKDPCVDFYEFACGTYEQQSILFPEDSEGIFTAQEMENEMLLNLKQIIDSISAERGEKRFSLFLVKKLYDDCINTDHHPDVLTKNIWKHLFGENGMMPWPLLNKNMMNEEKHRVRMVSLSLFYQVNPFFTMSVYRGETANNRTLWIFQFRKSENLDILQIIHTDADVEDEESPLLRYLFAFGKILTEVGVDVDDLKNIVPKIVDLELEEFFIGAATKAEESSEKVYEKNDHLRNEFRNYTCEDLDRRMPHVKWCKVVEQLRSDYGLPKNSDIRIAIPSLEYYFNAVNSVLGRFPEKDIINYIALKFIMGHLRYMPSPLRQIYFREKDLFPGEQKHWTLSARWQQCVDIVSDVLWLPLEKEYLREKLDEAKRSKLRQMVKKIKDSYISLIDRMSWMRASLPEKDPVKPIQNVNLFIGRSEFLLDQDDAVLDNYFENAIPGKFLKTANKTLLEDILLLLKVKTIASLSLREEIYTVADSPNFGRFKYFSSYQESSGIPYSVLSYSMTLSGRPMFDEYANLGSLIFSYISNFLMQEVEVERYSLSVQAYNNAASCLKEQYHLQKTGKMKFKVDIDDEIRLLRELLSAVGTLGSFQAYMDYMKENGEEKGLPGLPFSNEQLFFISNAQSHCEKFTEKGYANFPPVLTSPARYRVNVPLANSKAFSKAFRCPAGSPMNPKRKCCLLGDGMLSQNCD